MGPHEIAEQMEVCLQAMDELLDETLVAGKVLAEDERRYKVKFAQARLTARTKQAKPTVDSVNDEATIMTEEELFDYRIAESTMTVCRESLRVQQAKLDALRSMSASIRGAGG